MLTRIPSSSAPRRTARSAFTLIELLVVVGIIALLVAILIPALGATRKVARKTANIASLNALQTALSAYANDFQNAYPLSHDPSSPYPGNQYNSRILPGRGNAMLAQGLMGYLPGTIDGAGPDTLNAAYAQDPHYGFRLHSSAMGKIYGPYASDTPKYYKINTTTGNFQDQVFLDASGNEILYFSSNYSTPPTTSPNMVFGPVGTSPTPYFTDSDDENSITTAGATLARPAPTLPSAATATKTFFQTLGIAPNGATAASNNITPVTGSVSTLLAGKDSYILISAGEDGTYYDDDDLIATKP